MRNRFLRKRRLDDFLAEHDVRPSQLPRSLRGLTSNGRFVFTCVSADGHPVAVLRWWPRYSTRVQQGLRQMAREASDFAAGWRMFLGRPTPNPPSLP